MCVTYFVTNVRKYCEGLNKSSILLKSEWLSLIGRLSEALVQRLTLISAIRSPPDARFP